MLTLYLVRHARSVDNAAQRVQGWLDSELDNYGLQQAALVGERFRPKRLTALYASPLTRAARTARAIADACGVEIVFDERLREYHMGAWTGMTPQEIEAVMPQGWFDGNVDRVGPGGESALDMRARVESFLADVLARHPDGLVAAVAHGGTIGAMVSSMLGLPAIRRQPFSFGNTSITKVTCERGRWRIRSLNDRCHLQALSEER
jgi:broad specificity phosphatase PhoE